MTRPFCKIFLLWASVTIIIGGLVSWALAGVNVIVPAENTVAGERIILGDIATVAPDSPEDQKLADILASVDLGQAPGPGRRIVIRRQILEQRLNASGVPLSEARFSLPAEVTLTGTGQSSGDLQIRQIVLDYLAKTEPYVSGRAEIVSLTSAKPPVLPLGRVEYRFVPLPSSNPGFLTGTIFFTVDGQEAARLRITCQIDLQMEALVAARDLSRGQILAEGDLAESLVPYSQSKGALKAVSQAVGQTLRVSLRTGSPVRDRDLVKTSLVKKGETVTIIAQSGGLKVTALGQARQDGALGQTIAVVNQDSKKTISAKVIGPGMVEVMF
ncbi:MAG: flagellar basal body P-ring formation chaperone FlgA [Deltaproteobacteria bacterium]|jgi:flagella basal body P-ring formation protein FlgA|nr:flagellar basal body P-ring formation chaperone FlgA [Deltaproteobacteria bacterium]